MVNVMVHVAKATKLNIEKNYSMLSFKIDRPALVLESNKTCISRISG